MALMGLRYGVIFCFNAKFIKLFVLSRESVERIFSVSRFYLSLCVAGTMASRVQRDIHLLSYPQVDHNALSIGLVH